MKDPIGALPDPVTWYGTNYTGTQVTQWNFQNKEKSGWSGTSSFVLEATALFAFPNNLFRTMRPHRVKGLLH